MKPMLFRVEGAQSQGAVYRRVVLRNITCTVGIVISYLINSVITGHIQLTRASSTSQGSDKVGIISQFIAYLHLSSPFGLTCTV